MVATADRGGSDNERGSGVMRLGFECCLAAGLVLLACSTAAAQRRWPGSGDALVAIAHRDLRFGTVLPGINSSIRPYQLRRAGLFEVRGRRNTSIRIDLALPATMTSTGGHEMPLVFGSGDAIAAPTPDQFPATWFNPHDPLVTVLGFFGRLFVALGGTVEPARGQAGGAYSATISLSVYNLGS